MHFTDQIRNWFAAAFRSDDGFQHVLRGAQVVSRSSDYRYRAIPGTESDDKFVEVELKNLTFVIDRNGKIRKVLALD